MYAWNNNNNKKKTALEMKTMIELKKKKNAIDWKRKLRKLTKGNQMGTREENKRNWRTSAGDPTSKSSESKNKTLDDMKRRK